ncbi:pyocin knob domain-containing protein [Priestia aryabhattai]|uniref:pyocin knob domain-containing protein n=1 Tax=Priestia aryabhattai TaxID=412384 RepID=UPI0039A0F232
MTFQKINGFSKKVANLPDVPTLSAAELKAYFDSSPEEVRVALNNLIDALGNAVDGDSGADGIGVTNISGVTGNTVQTILESLKGIIDTKTDKTGDHAGTWGGYTTSNFPVGVTSEQLMKVAPALPPSTPGENYPFGVSLMHISNVAGWPQLYGLVVTFRYDSTRVAQLFYRTYGARESYWRYYSAPQGWGSWYESETTAGAQEKVDAKIKGGMIQYGTFSLTLPANGNGQKTITFDQSFPSSPALTGNARNTENPERYGNPVFTNVTATSCVVTAQNFTGSSQTVNYSWMGMG